MLLKAVGSSLGDYEQFYEHSVWKTRLFDAVKYL